MAQQKVLLAVCLVAGLVAVAQCQLNFSNCGRQMQQLIAQYQTECRGAMETLVANLQQRGGQATDMSQFQTEMDSLMSEMQSIANVANGFDGPRAMQSWTNIMRIQGSMVVKAMQNSFFSGAISEWNGFLVKIMSSNSNLVTRATVECGPTQG